MIFYLIFRYLVYHFKTFERLGIPGPKPTFFLGNLLEIRQKVKALSTTYKRKSKTISNVGRA